MLDPGGAPFPVELLGRSAALLVGPEGGWTDSERDRARGAGWVLTGLPAGTLRAETAAVAAVVLARAGFEKSHRC
jgi:RsmE family RNA methyltransferase